MTESQHPSDEQLSAAIDGVDAGAAAHAAECPRCSYRLEAMRGVASAIGTPPPPSDAVRERVLAAAMKEDVAGSAPSSLARSTPPFAWIAGIAAALLLAVLVVPALLGGGDGRAGRMADDSGDAEMMAGGDAADVETADLGSFNDSEELAAAIRPLIGEDAGDGTEGAASPTTTAAAPAGGQRAAGGGGAEFSSGTPCESTVRDEYGQGLGRQVYAALLTWQGAPAVVLAYEVEGAEGPLDHRVFVLSREACTLLTVLSV